MNKTFYLDLQDLFESDSLFYALELASEGGKAHRCSASGLTPSLAAQRIAQKLVPFIQENLIEEIAEDED